MNLNMNEQQKTIELYANINICNIVRDHVKINKELNLCSVFEVDTPNIIMLCFQGSKKTYSTPIRLGAILDQIIYYKNYINNDNILINFNGATLNVHQGIFINKFNEQIYLTEKEVSIFLFLYSNRGRDISREELLESIWNYATDVETHTLETHIYRLRQKIEENPAKPVILITNENGYSVHT